jgi:hypothetical protein
MSYQRIRDGFTPAPLPAQIEEIKRQLYLASHALQRQVDKQRLHPERMACHMHRLRSVLYTLEDLHAQQQQSAPPGTQAAA